jgi:hypothetical protein
MAAEAQKRNVHPLWLWPSAMTFIAFYEKVFKFGGLVVEVCRVWLDFSRTFWERLFALSPSVSVPQDPALYDMLTLWVTASFAIWFFPLLTPASDGRVKTTVDALGETLRLPPPAARGLGFIVIALAILVVAAPFGAFDSSPERTLVETLQQSAIVSGGGLADWLSGGGLWFAVVLAAFGAAALSYVYFVIGPRLAAAELSDEEKRDLIVIAAALWLTSAALLAAAVFLPAGLFGLGRLDLMVLSLLSLVGLVAWRSALPFVQLAVLIVAAVAVNEALEFLIGVWRATNGG